MVEQVQNGCEIYVPTFGDKAARFLGFWHHLGQEPPRHEELTQGWARTETRLRFDLGDRIRLLITGKVNLSHTHYTDGRFDTMQTRMDMRFPAPWERDNG